jgi:hypothetical protein
MNLPAILSGIIFVLAFGTVYSMGYDFQAGKARENANPIFNAPYYFVSGELISYLNAFFFVFIFSLLFFGYSAPIAMGIEGGKFAALFVSGLLKPYDFVFVIPEFFAAYSAILLGQGVLEDFEGKTVFEKWASALKFFVVGLVLTAIFYGLRVFVVK